MTPDRRQQHLTLTEKGRQKWQTAHMLLQECEQKLLKHLSGQNSRELEEAFRTVIKAFTQGARVEKVKKAQPVIMFTASFLVKTVFGMDA